MTCANILLTIFALIVIAMAAWPTLLGAGNAMWVNVIMGILIIIVAWTGVKCKYCKK